MKTKSNRSFKAALLSFAFAFLLDPVFADVNGFSKTRAFEQNSKLSAVELYNLGLDYYDKKDWWQAGEKFQEAIQKNGAYADAWYMLSKCSYEMNQFDLCVQYVENAQKYAGEKPEYSNLKAFSFISLGKFKEAETLFNSTLKKYPNNIEARFGLAELDLFNGRLTGAEILYKDALKREPLNVKALLSLALVSTELGKKETAQNYINKALQSHSNNEEVYFIASYLAAMNGDYKDAEKKCLMAVTVNPNYDGAYELLSTIYYAQKRYEEVIDIADFRINRNRNASQAWYIKGLALEKLGRFEDSIATWEAGLEVEPYDEIMRTAFELSVLSHTRLEDPRRKNWALYHVRKGQEYQKKFASLQVRYEYQTALKINPKNKTARTAFAEILYNDGFNENYLEQVKFVKENTKLLEVKDKSKLTDREEAKMIRYTRLSDTVEGFESLMENTLAKKWDINPFYLDKTRWNIGIYYMEKIEPLYHCDIARIAAENLRLMFQGISSTNVRLFPEEVSGYADAYKKAHDKKLDYFIILTGDETDRDVKLDAVMYSARTGTKTKDFSIYRTGNERFSLSLLHLRKAMLSILPVRANILNRSLSDILLDIGKTEGVVKNSKFAVIKKGALKTSDTGAGLVYNDSDMIGTVTVTKVSEEISEGVLSDTGFYDRVNSGDELILIEVPSKKESSETPSEAALDTAPQSTNEVTAVNALKGADLEITRTPSLIRMIKELN